MLSRKSSRRVVKQALGWARVRLIYSRITLTKFTTLYFFTALLTCVALSILQTITYFDNKAAGDLIQTLRDMGNSTASGIVVEISGELQLCRDLPQVPGSNCTDVSHKADAHQDNNRRELFEFAVSHEQFRRGMNKKKVIIPEVDGNGTIEGVRLDGNTTMGQDCLQSLHFFGDMVRDAEKEDLLTLAFEFWLLSLSLVAILNESLPHLGAAMAAHVLGTSWAAFRVVNSKHQENMYQDLIVHGACGVDVLGGWWTVRENHAYIIVGFNIVALFAASYLSFKLYRVYSLHSFRLAGESPIIHKAYKLVLFLSVLLHLAGFFILGSTALWIDKISMGALHSVPDVTKHFPLYLTIFIVIAVVDVPWLVLGWISVRRENRLLFVLFGVISFLMLGISTVMFSSLLFRYVFGTWPFFAVIIITAYVLTVSVPVVAILCRLRFGKGLPEYLKRKEELEGQDFAPVYFTQDSKRSSATSFDSDTEKGYGFSEEKSSAGGGVYEINFNTFSYTAGTPKQAQPKIQNVQTAHTSPSPRPTKPLQRERKSSLPRPRAAVTSIYSDVKGDTLKLSTTPPVAQPSGPSPLSAVEVASIMQRDRSEHSIPNPTFMGGYF